MSANVVIVDRSAEVLAALELAVGGAVKQTGDEMAAGMRAEMLAAKSGAMYGSHQASAPGEAPANWHGKLLETIQNEVLGPAEVSVNVGSHETQYFVDYLEFGSAGGKIAARPMVQPAAEAIKPVLVENITKAVQAVK
jgi:hypothetical protein